MMPRADQGHDDAFEESRQNPPRDERGRRRPLRDPVEESDEPVSTIIPYKNPKALAAYYCGVFGLIPGVGLILGPIALILGILGIQYVKANPTAKGTGHAIVGIILGFLEVLFNWGIVVLLALGILTKTFR